MSRPEITVDPDTPTPPYEQIRAQIADLILAATLPAGHRLPPIRQLAADLGVANGTVARAYSELESAGLVQTKRAGGTLVAERPTISVAERQRLLAEQAVRYVAAARRLQVSDDQTVDAVRLALEPPV